MDDFLIEAMREVDALTPGSEPMAPVVDTPERRKFHHNVAVYHGCGFDQVRRDFVRPDGRRVSETAVLLHGVEVLHG